MISFKNIDVERLMFELFTNEICRNLFFLNKDLILENLDPDYRSWLKNLTYSECNRHSSCAMKKLEYEVFKCYFQLNLYFPKELNPLFNEFYLCNKKAPLEPFIEYCIKFGVFYNRNSLDTTGFLYINDLMRFSLDKLLTAQRKHPDFYSIIPKDWNQYYPVIPPYIKIQKFNYEINETIERIKNKELPPPQETIYLFSSIGEHIRIEKKPLSLMYFYNLCKQENTFQNILIQLKETLSSDEYFCFVNNELPFLFKNKSILFFHPELRNE